MHELYELKEMLMDEIREIVKEGKLTPGSLETVDKLLNSIKNACKIVMYDEYKDGGYSYEGDYSNESGYSNARGGNRGGGRRGGSRGYSNARGGRGYGRYSRDGGYSYGDEDNSEKINLLNEMMSEVSTEEEKRVIRRLMHEMENK